MELWGARLYGDPCRQCGWAWSGEAEDNIAYVRGVPGLYAQLLHGRSGSERHPDLAWSTTSYVCHVSDNLLMWAERVAGALRGGNARVGGYDPDELAAARRYEDVALPAALWSLARNAATWTDVLSEAVAVDLTLDHATRGAQRAADIASNNAHDANHHAGDIARILAA